MLAVLVFAPITLTLGDTNKKEIITFTPLQVRWFTPSYYTDGRERAQLLGELKSGRCVDRSCQDPCRQTCPRRYRFLR